MELGDHVTVDSLNFSANGYEIADADKDGSLTFVSPAIATVAAGCTGKLTVTVGGSAGLAKEGAGILEFNAANTYSGVTHVKTGILKLAYRTVGSLGATGAGNETIIESGAALDLNGSYPANRADDIIVSGAGFNGSGAIFSSATSGTYNFGFRNLTLVGDTTISTPMRWDLSSSGTYTGNGHTLTKTGGAEIAVSRALNGSPIHINQGMFTIQHAQALGGSDYNTFVNNGTLNVWGDRAISERIICTGANAALSQGDENKTADFTGHITVSNTLNFVAASRRKVLVSGYIDGPGGIAQNHGGECYITGNTNSYAGATVVGANSRVSVGLPDGSSTTGRLGSGDISVFGHLYYDRTGSYSLSNNFVNGGNIIVRHGGSMTLNNSNSTNSPKWNLSDGSLTLTNNATLNLLSREFVMAELQDYVVAPAKITARLTVTDGCSLIARAFICGNGSKEGASFTSIVHQVGGTITATGNTAEENGFRMGHYPPARTTWEISGGVMTCKTNDICMGTDGQGWFKISGGEVNTTRITVKERADNTGYGRLTICGGVLNLGSANPGINPAVNALTTDNPSRTLVELGGCGGVINAVTNIQITVNATLYGTNETAITFNSNGNTINLSGQLSGDGGFNKSGAGTMQISSSNNACEGDTFVSGGTLLLSGADALPNSAVYLAAGTTLDLGGHHQRIGRIRGTGSVINGTYTFTKPLFGTIILIR
ncbi:MAG: autotransporter-associated beta strand repeat-containing protein [Kiritimatiellae bacterium]|nr:autotransporter-associated beta strand repeat-containing protein [Kiritimatiellia bacterium]